MQKTRNTVEQKLAEAARLIKEAGEQLEEAGLKADFEIKITALS